MKSKRTTLTCLLLALFLACTALPISHAAPEAITVKVNGVPIDFPDALPILEAGRVSVPVRFVSEALGANVNWLPIPREVHIRQQDRAIVMVAGETEVKVNDEIVKVDAPAQHIGSRVFVPLRFVSEMLEASVHWREDTRTVEIIKEDIGEDPGEEPEEDPAEDPGDDPGEEEAEDKEEQDLTGAAVSFVVSPQLLPEGGGQTATIIVTVADKAGKPVAGATVYIDAEVVDGAGRNAQLSLTETETDASGKATVTYTTLAKDDRQMIDILLSVYKVPNLEVHDKYQIMASNRAALVAGTVRDPYNGAPLKDIMVCFISKETNQGIGCAETDEQGRYSMIVPTGTYGLDFKMPIRDALTVKVDRPGQTHTVNNHKGILKGVVTGVSSGKMVMAIPPGFKHHDDAWTLQADIKSDGSFVLALAPGKYELFIVGRDTPFKAGVTVESGKVTDIGTVGAR